VSYISVINQAIKSRISHNEILLYVIKYSDAGFRIAINNGKMKGAIKFIPRNLRNEGRPS
jgi:hypothetical protein